MAAPLRVGVISANWGMLAHLPAWRALGVEVAAVCTARRETAEAAAARYGIAKAYWDHAEMAADPTLDIVDVGTRPDLRRDMVLTAIAHGKHVFASANFAADLESAEAMYRAARMAGVACALDSTLAWVPAHRRVNELMAEGYLGRPAAVATRFNISLFNGPEPVGDYWRWFAERRHGASALRNLGTHSLHLLVELFGPIRDVVAQGTIALPAWRFTDGMVVVPETEDTAQLLLRFETGVLGTLAVGWSSPALLGWQMELSGDRGTLVTRDAGFFPSGPSVELLAAQDGRPLAPIAVPARLLVPPDANFITPPAFPQSYDIAGVMGSLVRAIREGGTPNPDFARAFHVEAVLDAARRSIVERRWITVDAAPV